MGDASQSELTAAFERWYRWRQTLDEIMRQLLDLHQRRHVWSRYRAYLVDRWELGDLADTFHDWASKNYADAMTIGIRRNLDRDTRAVSLVGVMLDMAKSAAVWKSLADLPPPPPRAISPNPQEFIRAAKRIAALSSDDLKREVEALRVQVEEILTHADKRIAHTDSDKRNHALPKWERLDEALDAVTAVFLRYHEIVSGAPCVFEDPSIVMPWEFMLPDMLSKKPSPEQ